MGVRAWGVFLGVVWGIGWFVRVRQGVLVMVHCVVVEV